jgi:hypothetical protein
MSHTMTTERALEILNCWCKTSPHNEQLCAARDHIAQALRDQAEPPAGWRDLMRELADDLEWEIKTRSAGELPRRIERDMAPVRRARALLADESIASNADRVPEGWQLVPKVPTEAMCRAGLSERHDDLAKSIYAAMLAATPSTPA